jgi:hypothetical protein
MSFLQSVKAAGKTAAKPVVDTSKEIKREYVATRAGVTTSDLEGGIEQTALRLVELVTEANKRDPKVHKYTDLAQVVLKAQATHADDLRKENEAKEKAAAENLAAKQRIADEALRIAAEAQAELHRQQSNPNVTV